MFDEQLASVVSLMATFTQLQAHGIARERISPLRYIFPFIPPQDLLDEQREMQQTRPQPEYRRHVLLRPLSLLASPSSTSTSSSSSSSSSSSTLDQGEYAFGIDEFDPYIVPSPASKKHQRATNVFYLVCLESSHECIINQ